MSDRSNSISLHLNSISPIHIHTNSRVAPEPVLYSNHNNNDIATSIRQHNSTDAQFVEPHDTVNAGSNTVFYTHDAAQQQQRDHATMLVTRQNSDMTSRDRSDDIKLYSQQLIHYKYVDDKRDIYNNTVNEPLHVILPNNRIMIAQCSHVIKSISTTNNNDNESNDEQNNYNNNNSTTRQRINRNTIGSIIMYYNANPYSLPDILYSKYKYYAILSIILMLCDILLFTLLYAKANIFDYYLTQYYSGNDSLMYTLNIITCALGLSGLLLHDTRMMTLFTILWYCISLYSLLRVYSVVQYVHFILQIFTCHSVRQCRLLVTSMWSNPL